MPATKRAASRASTLAAAAVAALVVGFPAPASAHVGSPDVVHEGDAGPYRVLVSVRPPQVIPGVAEVEVDSSDPDIQEVKLVPMPLGGDGARFAPTPDLARPVEGTHSTFVARLWMMSAGPWQVRVTAAGGRGEGALAVPVPALPSTTRGMQGALAASLVALMLFLSLGLVWIVWAAVAEAELPAGERPDEPARRRARRGAVVAAVLTVASLWGGSAWWDAEAEAYGRYVYKPIALDATVADGKLTLSLRDPGWLKSRRLDDLVPDHDHLMHLFLVRLPDLDRVYHLHPTPTAENRYAHEVPADAPAGRYALFADVVHGNGLPETAVAEIDLPPPPSAPIARAAAGSDGEKAPAPRLVDADDSSGSAPPVAAADDTRRVSALADGRMVFLHDAGPLRSDHVERLRFRVDDAGDQPSPDLELYMGMPGHAVILRHDRVVFAHIHPSGSVPMPSLALAQSMMAGADGGAGKPADPHAGHHMAQHGLPSEVSFPYRFPGAGAYRVFVQVKRRGRVETGAFDVKVE